MPLTMPERTQIALKLILTHILLLPVLLLLSLMSVRDGFLSISIMQTILIILYFSGYWEFFKFRFRVKYCMCMEFFLLAELAWKVISQPSGARNPFLVSGLLIIQVYLIYQVVKIIITIFKKEKVVVEIEFPFRNGKFLITDGGNSRISRLMNYHFYSQIHKKNKTNNSMLFATDIVRIGRSGNNFLPRRNEDYVIFGQKVFSPVRGKVIKVENDINDNIPYSGSYPYNTGNTVIIRNQNRYLILDHLKMGSIIVKAGDSIQPGETVAEAGNSGYAERPHLHMQLIESSTDEYWKGRGVSIHFRQKNLYKNRLIYI